MRRWRGLNAVPTNWGRCVVTIGTFDGVHRGHRQLIESAVQRARALGLPCVLLTFDPHPAEVVRPGSHPAQLTTLRRRAELVEELGVDVFCVIPFTSEVAKTPPDTFAHEVLVERLHAAAVVVGKNFTFGYRAQGNVALLEELGSRFGFAVEGTELLAEDRLTFSSTYIRSCLSAGDVDAATEALGRPYRLEGIVVRGDGRGRELGFPTANLSTHRYAAIPGDGVYACYFALRSHERGHPRRLLRAAVSVGTNPTFSGEERRVEAFVLDVAEDFYGEHVELDFVARLRDMERYDAVQQLIDQMEIDVQRTREILADGM
ncbi:bifunctional riboflavin kinase/FAD synthetase [Actinoalloteichus hymeniacidonis]|uniref:Riboflavin biosynthesis protein n=1 Tax=Actinoalloteichus hymeniacidonis TaxID=340345 RepID=A0AAC9HNQ7_9PSEU|nr:bifunctional riboflavin kinase/FAD synthetase [Actinoalloteichus hymeniacidonis]AOS62662.1 FMN adenylyltransferase /riboflavin kinase [Actinoalloteichus hymeniacidonis]MBB5909307.1 riboflavin kinase/FMN adenylyltransferase [Actinoalloteichus hymeniacidonis]